MHRISKSDDALLMDERRKSRDEENAANLKSLLEACDRCAPYDPSAPPWDGAVLSNGQGENTMTEQAKRAYQTGFTDAETRTRKRAMGPMYRLAYTCGWFDRKLGRPCLYTVSA